MSRKCREGQLPSHGQEEEVAKVTAEPRMEELLASIRKAIHDDIGEVPSSAPAHGTASQQRAAMRELHSRVGDAAASAAAEIQQLREKINRSRGAVPPAHDLHGYTPQPTMAPAHETSHHEAARRSWRDLEPPPPLRPSLIESDSIRPPPLVRRPVESARHDLHMQPGGEMSGREHPASASALPPSGSRDVPSGQSMMSPDASEAVHAAFNRLAETMFSRAAGERSLEELAREMLRGMLKQWLDDNLPALVERLVREEIERVARRGR